MNQPTTALRDSNLGNHQAPPMDKFIYFDMGNVLLKFDEQRAIRQMAEVAGITPERVREIVFDSGMQNRYEHGEISRDEYYETFCSEGKCRPDPGELERAGSDMFELNVPIVPLVVHLSAAGYGLGLLSNTCVSHWDFVRQRYTLLRAYFQPIVLSFEVGAMKPADRIYQVAIQQAGVPAESIVYVDDRPENVEGAVRCGLDAVLFEEVAPFARQLHQRGIRSNY